MSIFSLGFLPITIYLYNCTIPQVFRGVVIFVFVQFYCVLFGIYTKRISVADIMSATDVVSS